MEDQSAMSKKLMPRSRARRRMGIESPSSSTQPVQAELPIDMVPRHSCETASSVRPNRMQSMRDSLRWGACELESGHDAPGLGSITAGPIQQTLARIGRSTDEFR